MSSMPSRQPVTLTRRSLLASTAVLGVGATVGCSQDAGRSDAGENLRFDLPDPVGSFPTEDIEFRLVDSNDTKVPFWKSFFAAYEKKHPHVSTQYDGLPWARIEEVVPLGFRNGSAHDLIQLPDWAIPLSQAVDAEWIAPLDDHIPDFENWKQNVPGTSLVEGVQVFDGKLYQVRISSDRRYQASLHYSKRLLNDVGFDPQTEPLTWDTYREAARKVTEKGDGQAYGVILEIGSPGRLASWVAYFARIAGAPVVDDILQPSGEFYYTTDEVKAAIDLLLAVQSDGSIFPGSGSLTSPECWPRVARENAAMVSGGPWITVFFEKENPDFEFGVGAHPAPAGADPVPVGYTTIGGDAFCMFAGSQAKDVAGDILGYVTSLPGQTNWGEITGVGNPPVLDEAAQASAEKWSEPARMCLNLANTMVAKPEPVIANPDVAKVARNQKPVSPNFGDVIQAILVGEVSDVDKALQDVKDRSERAFDEAIKEAQQREGSTATRDDYVFANWDPMSDYTLEHYAGR